MTCAICHTEKPNEEFRDYGDDLLRLCCASCRSNRLSEAWDILRQLPRDERIQYMDRSVPNKTRDFIVNEILKP